MTGYAGRGSTFEQINIVTGPPLVASYRRMRSPAWPVWQEGGTPSLHESSSVTSATKPRKRTSNPSSDKSARSKRYSFHSTAPQTNPEASLSLNSAMQLLSPRQSKNLTAPNSMAVISVSVKLGIAHRAHQARVAASWTTVLPRWTSVVNLQNPREVVAAYAAGSGASSGSTHLAPGDNHSSGPNFPLTPLRNTLRSLLGE